MNTQTIQLGSQTIRVSVKPGKPNTIPLLIFTGIGASLSLLAPFVEAMHESNPDTPIITFDYPGVSGSSTPFFPYRFSGLAKIVSDMLDYLNVGQVDVLGLSWGGFICQQFTYDFPHRVNKVILCATTSGVLAVPPSLKVLGLMSSPRRYSDPEYAQSIAADIYGGKFRTIDGLAAKHAERVSQNKSDTPHSQLGYHYQQLALWGWSSLWFLNQIKQPTLLIVGDDDPLIAVGNMKVMNMIIPNSKLKVLEGEGHLFLLTSTEESVQIIEEFFGE